MESRLEVVAGSAEKADDLPLLVRMNPYPTIESSSRTAARMTGIGMAILWALVGLTCLVACSDRSDTESAGALQGPPFPDGDWRHILVDDQRGTWGDFDQPAWLRYFGLAVGDLTGDGYLDIVSGRYFYRNPGGDMSGQWVRRDLGRNLDAILITDIDGDSMGDLIAQALPDVEWVEATDRQGNAWTVRKISEAPKTGHINSQGFAIGQITPGGKPEIVLASGKGIYYYEVPEDPTSAQWPRTLVTEEATDEGLDVADIDGDGLPDVIAARGAEYIAWWRNPGHRTAEAWERHRIGTTEPYDADRIRAVDIDGDGRTDVVATQELVSRVEPDASLYWFRQPNEATSGGWPRRRLLTEYSLNSLDTADLDGDGDIDILTGEHKGPHLRLQLLENNGQGEFLIREIDRGKESHLGTLSADLDRDGDMDIVSVGWDQYRELHVWRNDGYQWKGPVCWKHVSNQAGTFVKAGVGPQSSALLLDLDKDGRDDFVIAGWARERSMVWFRSLSTGPQRYLIDDRQSHIEAGGDAFDIDADGDLDIIQGGSWNTNEIWWWENPHPEHVPDRPWKRHTIKAWGETQHHDLIVGDFDGDGSAELAFWNQQARKLFLADIPEQPRDPEAWRPVAIWSWPQGSNYEGLARADVDLDGKDDLIGGGLWFKHIEGKKFQAHTIDPDYGFSRSAAGDFIEGGRPEIVLGSGDNRGPLNLYEWRDGTWRRSTLIADLDHGHTLRSGDINGDGHLDIYTAEMHTPGAASACRQLVLYGDGRGGFSRQVVSTGIGSHEGKLGDLDGDGDLDILQKDFKHERRVDIWLNEGTAGARGGSSTCARTPAPKGAGDDV